MGLHVPVESGGRGQGLQALTELTAVIGPTCPSPALCFGMHCVANAVIAAEAMSHQQEKYRRRWDSTSPR